MFSSQSQAGVTFSIAGELQSCRLLELPPDLLEYITSCSSGAQSLHFKAKDESDPEAFLCTQDKTYLLRQQNTSNSVYLTTPSSDASGIVAVSQCSSALEALPAPAHHAKSILRSLLTPFGHPSDLDIPPTNARTRDNVFAHTPMSHAECHAVWKDLTAFEASGQSFRPTATALVNAWKWLLEIAYAHGVDLSSRPLQKQSLDAMLEGEDEWPRQLADAILLNLTDNHDQEATIKWLGQNILEARHQNPSEPSTMEKTAFMTTWKDSLPEPWRNLATLDVLGSSCKLSASGKHVEFAAERIAQTGEATAGAPKPAAAATGKRKWHEKFAAARKQGKPS